MNRNVESHFAELPRVDVQRSIFDHSASHKTSFNVGQLVPFFLEEVLPGSTFKVTTSLVARMQTLLTPIMDNVYLDTYFFYVPNRLVWDHWINFMGESQKAWIPEVQYSVPTLTAPAGGWNVGTIADYMGIPVGVEGLEVNALPFRAYALICNEWFRDQNLTDPLVVNTDDNNEVGVNGEGLTSVALGGLPFKVSKYHDYFTSCLPSPQKGPQVTFDLISGELAPVGTRQELADGSSRVGGYSLEWTNLTGTTPNKHRGLSTANYSGRAGTVLSSADVEVSGSAWVQPANLWADLSTSLGAVSVNDLRLAFAMQKFYERSARGGSRYRETLLSHFGVHSPDARMMIPEYLGGHRVPLSIHQVANTSQGENDFLGDLGAMSNTSDVHEDFIHSFVEHGFVIGVCCVRYDHSYPQGVEKMWLRKNMFDYYWPELANVGEMPVYKKQIMATGEASDDQVFGYQEAWAEYRYKPNRVSGEMRPGIPNSLASWHLADYYTTVPSLSDSWIREDKANVDRVLAVTSSVSNQIFADFYVKNIATMPMPVFSIPGLIDHH